MKNTDIRIAPLKEGFRSEGLCVECKSPNQLVGYVEKRKYRICIGCFSKLKEDMKDLKKHSILKSRYRYDKVEEELNELSEEQDSFELITANKFREAIGEVIDYKRLGETFIDVQPIYYDNAKLWWIWNFNKKCWKIIDETDLMNKFDECAQWSGSINSKVKAQLLEILKRRGRLNKPKNIKPTWIQFKNKIIDFESGEEFEPSPEYFTTNPISWNIPNGKEETPTMDKLFEEWVGKEYVQSLYEIIAFCCITTYPLHRIICLIGSGLNGKTTFLKLIEKFVGKNNCCSVELEDLLTSRFQSSKLYKKTVCLMGETNFNTMQRTSILKRLTGQDKVPFEFKGKDPFDGENYAKIIIATNTLPETNDKTKGFYRRWFIVDFFNEFSEKEDVLKKIPESEYENLARKIIKIIKEVIRKGEFTNEGTIEERTKKFEEKSNPLGKFIEEEFTQDINGKYPFFMFYERFLVWIKNNKYRIESKLEVSQKLRKNGYEIKIENIKKEDGGYTSWRMILGLNSKNIPYFTTKEVGKLC